VRASVGASVLVALHACSSGGATGETAGAAIEATTACGSLAASACLEAASASLLAPTSDRGAVAEQFAAVCDAGLAAGCIERGRMHRMGRGVERSESAAEAWYMRACALSDGAGCHAAGLVALRATPPRYADAVGRFERGCGAEEPHACVALGRVLRDGTGVAQHAARGLALLAQGCAGGVLEACTERAVMVIDGIGVEPDPVGGASMMRLACNQGELRACHEAATLYAEGVGVAPDPEAALALWRTACVGRVPEACAALEGLRP
jgi:uncharacterized protein